MRDQAAADSRIVDTGFCPDCGAPAVFAWKWVGYCKVHYKERADEWTRHHPTPQAGEQEQP